MPTKTVFRLKEHLALGVVGSALTGALDFASTLLPWARAGHAAAPTLGLWFAPLAAAVVMSLCGLPLGLASFAAELGLARAGDSELEAAAAARRRLAVTLAAGVLLGSLAAAAALFTRAAFALQDETFAARLAAFAWVIGGAAVLASHRLLARGLERVLALRASDRAVRWIRNALALGVAALLFAFMRKDQPLLGTVLLLPYACMLGLVALLVGASPADATIRRASHKRGFWVTWAVLLLIVAPGLSAVRSVREALAPTLGPEPVLLALQSLTDVDRDGQSGLFGGSDCAPFDARRSALAFDVPGNRVDEDCSGRDQKPSVRASLPAPPLPEQYVESYNVLFVIIDALRADWVGLGRKQSLTPALDRLARESVVFTQAFSPSSTTRIAFPSFLAGVEVGHLRWAHRGAWLQPRRGPPTLAQRLKRRGYRTGLVVNAWMVSRMSDIQRGYDVVANVREPQGQPVPAALAGPSSTARAIEFLEQHLGSSGGHPFFLTVYYEGPHAPYDDQSDAGFAARSQLPVHRYDSEVRYADHQVGHLLDHLRVKPQVWAHTVVIVAADHGEEFGEHGGREHSRTCYTESTRVPLIIRVPELAPTRAPGRVSLVDVVPTVLALVGAEPDVALDGRNILRENPARYAQEPDARVACAYFPNKNPTARPIHAVRDQHWLYVEHFGTASNELYDTRADPGERNNLASRAELAPVIGRLRKWTTPLVLR